MSGYSKYPYSYYDSNGRERHFGEDDKEIIITFKPQDADKVIETLAKSAPKATIQTTKLVDTGKGKPEKVTISYLNEFTGFARVSTTPGSAFNSTMKSLTSSPATEVITAAMPALLEENKKGVDAIIHYLPGRLAVRLKKELVEGYYYYEKYKEEEDKNPEETERLKFKSDYQEHCQSILNKYNLKIEKVAFSPGLFSVSFPKAQGVSETEQLFSALENHAKPNKESPPKLEVATKVDGHMVGLDAGLQGPGGGGYTPNDLVNDPAQWGANTAPGNQHCNVLDAWRNVTVGYENNVHVAVLDTGVDIDHPDIRDPGVWSKIKKKFNAITGATTYGSVNDNDSVDSHGTNVAGIIGASTHNGIGIAAVAHDCGLYIVKVADPGLSTLDYLDVVAGIDDVTSTAIAYGPPPAGTNTKRYVMNLSFRLNANYGLVSTAIADAYNACVVIVAAAGESAPGVAGVDINTNNVWPACYTQVIPVSAHRNLANAPRTTESYFGDATPGKRCIRAPGQGIPTTQRGGTIQQKSQTSIAAGFVSAAAALCWSKNRINSGFPTSTGSNQTKRDQIYNALYQVYGGSGGGGDAGRLNVHNAVNYTT